jgi:hypothetical protein
MPIISKSEEIEGSVFSSYFRLLLFEENVFTGLIICPMVINPIDSA